MVFEINKKLESGWSPCYEEKNILYRSFEDCQTKFLELQRKEVKDGIKREVSCSADKSYLKK
ncbi:hypothetical protein BTO06_16050 [Tenacibaculum sp. SZ-18]|uniref:hypothetical protein n=1 Tax=Tenacibaculum sp. SZ-18 TaxID=754423 RepID=UPI000C2CE727|nr:hypothetical protein [Tenacibaculum sp. SZ-18]AUC16567.1 hypothetical protein BTO06_16050 [Tenacibaculum sp. SZ-18]